jgi:hypothetical protein
MDNALFVGTMKCYVNQLLPGDCIIQYVFLRSAHHDSFPFFVISVVFYDDNSCDVTVMWPDRRITTWKCEPRDYFYVVERD